MKTVFQAKTIKCLCLKMSKQIVQGFLNLLFPSAFVQKHSPNSKGSNINSSGTSRFWNKTIFWGQEQQKQKITHLFRILM